MSRVSVRNIWPVLACLAMFTAVAFVAGPSAAKADDTTWICKPGDADDLCAGTIAGRIWFAGQAGPTTDLGYTRPENAPIDCFYLYPTQSEQLTPNSNLEKDPPIRRVVVQQARMFSSVCKVYAPMYKQVTYKGDQSHDSADVEVAYASAKAAFQDYLQNYNHGRGFILLGHSQGSAHTARLIDELVDKDAGLRSRFVGAIAPGANIYVPINEQVGGMYDNVPACSEPGQLGCVVAFSTYTEYPGDDAGFSRLNKGYWIYPESRPDQTKYEAMCTNPALLDGGVGTLKPLVNFDYLSGVPASEGATPWVGLPDYYKVECRRQEGAHWLNLSKVGLAGDERPDLGPIAASGINYHVPEVNLAEGNLLAIAQQQSDGYLARQAQIAKLQNKLKGLTAKKLKTGHRLSMTPTMSKRLAKRVKSASGPRKQALKRKLKKVRRQAAADRRAVKALGRQIAAVKRQIAELG